MQSAHSPSTSPVPSSSAQGATSADAFTVMLLRSRRAESESSELLPLPRFEEPTPLPRLLPTAVVFFGLFNTLAPSARPLPLEVAVVDALPVAAEGITFSESEESSMTILSGTFLLFVCVDVIAPRLLLFALVVAAAAAAALPLFFGTDFTSSKSL